MQLGAYAVEGELGRGGMGVVLRARAPDGRPVAVKLLLPGLATDEALARFGRERALLSRLGEAEGFVPLLDSGRAPQGPFIVMPLLEGGTLRDRLRQGPLAVEDALALGRALARAMARAHAVGVVHRDLKPENVLFARDGRPLIGDLGLAREVRADGSRSSSGTLTATGIFVGTPGYAPPEQLDDSRRAGPACDVFALGAILYECLAGRAAFAGGGLLDVVARIRSGKREPLASLRPEVPPWLVAVVDHALAVSPEERLADAALLSRALEAGGKAAPSRVAAIALGLAAAAALALGGTFLAGRGRAANAPPETPAPPPSPRARAVDPLERHRERLARARVDARKGDLATARAAIADVLDAAPSFAPAYVERAIVRFYAADLDGALADAKRAAELDPKLGEAYALQGGIVFERGQTREAEALATRAIELSPNIGIAFHVRGRARLLLGDHEAAIGDFDRAIAADPSRRTIYMDRAQAKSGRGDYAGAIDDLTRALELSPGREAEVLVERGTTHAFASNREAALADANRALELDPKRASAWELRSQLRLFDGELEGAQADTARMLELAPNDAGSYRLRSMVRRAAGDLAGSLADAKRGVELGPRNARGWAVLAMAQESFDAREALASVERALALDPDLAEALTERAILRCGTGDAIGAAADLDRSLSLVGTARAHATRGNLRAKTGDTAGAIADFEVVVARWPRSTEARMVRDELRKLRAASSSPSPPSPAPRSR